MWPPISDEISQLVRSLLAERSLLERVLGEDPRIASVKRLAELGDIRVVPDLVALFAVGDSLSSHVARTISELVRLVTPTQLIWLDDRTRDFSYDRRGAWWRLSPDRVSHLAQIAGFDPSVVGLIASHPSGFVRAAAVEVLAESGDGREIPYLALRANDWVVPVAARARALLIGRLRSDNRRAVLEALPFIVRLFGQRRRDHSEIERLLTAVLLSDGGKDALAHASVLDLRVRRTMYDLLTKDATGVERRVIDAGLSDSDAVIRARAIRSLVTAPGLEDRASAIERLLCDDPVPTVRRLALAAISEHMPERIAGVFPDALLDRAASVRDFARFVARTRQLPLIPRDVYVHGLDVNPPTRVSAAIEGVGETGTRADADLVFRFLDSPRARHRRSALRALAKLDAERAIATAINALADDASSVRGTAVDVLATNVTRLDFEIVSGRMRSLADPRVRRDVLHVLINASKWDAAAFLLEALTDPDETVRAPAARLIGRWIESFNRSQTQPTTRQLHRIHTLSVAAGPQMPEETARALRFCLKAFEQS